MKNLLLFMLFFGLVLGPAYSAEAGPANPGFFERVSEWFGDVFTFGDLAKAQRDLGRAENIIKDIESSKDAPDDFLRVGFERYLERLERAQARFRKALDRGDDVSVLANRLQDVTASHISKFGGEEGAFTDRAKEVGLDRALAVVKAANETAREAINEAKEKQAAKEEDRGVLGDLVKLKTIAPPAERSNETRTETSKAPAPTPVSKYGSAPAPAPVVASPLPTPTPAIPAELVPLQGVWKREKRLLTSGVEVDKEVQVPYEDYFSFKGNNVCFTALSDQCYQPYVPFVLSGEVITANGQLPTGYYSIKIYFRNNKIELHGDNEKGDLHKNFYVKISSTPLSER